VGLSGGDPDHDGTTSTTQNGLTTKSTKEHEACPQSSGGDGNDGIQPLGAQGAADRNGFHHDEHEEKGWG
jgi:hypothetical protein